MHNRPGDSPESISMKAGAENHSVSILAFLAMESSLKSSVSVTLLPCLIIFTVKLQFISGQNVPTFYF